MAEAKKLLSPRKAMKKLRNAGDEIEQWEETKAIMNIELDALKMQDPDPPYAPSKPENYFTTKFFTTYGIHIAIVKKQDGPTPDQNKMFSKWYTGLSKYWGTFNGFYASTRHNKFPYCPEKADGSKVEVYDVENLPTFNTLKSGNSFYYAGHEYKFFYGQNYIDDRWVVGGIGKQTDDMIVIICAENCYFVYNIAKEGNKERQVYGKLNSVHGPLLKLTNQVFLASGWSGNEEWDESVV